MKEIFTAVARELKKDASTDEVTALIRKHFTRRQFLVGSSALGLGVATFSILGCGASGAGGASETPRQVFVANALAWSSLSRRSAWDAGAARRHVSRTTKVSYSPRFRM